ncbi:MAG TPA: TonB-dependent receptor plug domain-containing protein [Candidatus Binatia bacterium]|jgi:outer membrane receptor protein involved in Fe transport
MSSQLFAAFFFAFALYAAPVGAEDDGAQQQQGSEKSSAGATSDKQATGATSEKPATEATEVYVWGQEPVSTATEQTIRKKDFELRPTSTPSDILRLVPGLFIAQHQGGGKADQIFLRGFDADHGTDVAVFIDGIPVNFVSHGHGQGYADLHWLIPEVVDHVEVYKGPYFVQFGDFNTAGAVNIVTKRRDPDSTLTAIGGSYNIQRGVAIFSPPENTPLKPFIAFEAYHELGPFKNPEDFIRYNIFSKFTLLSTATSNLNFTGTFFKSSWNASGEIPLREVKAGRLGWFDAVDPSEGGRTERQNLNLVYNYTDNDQSFNAQVWASRYRFDLFSNFTFSETNPFPVSDEIEQTDRRIFGGSYLNYRRHYTLFDIPTETLMGFSSRTDHARVGLFHASKGERIVSPVTGFATVSSSLINQTNLAWYVQQELRPRDWLRMQFGLRFDKFFFDVRNVPKAAENKPDGKVQDFIASPKVNVVLSPFTDNTVAKRQEIYLNFGSGFHSNDAREVVTDPSKTALPRALGGEIGYRTKLYDRFDLALDYWALNLSSELVWAGDDGTTEPKGRTMRHGPEGEFRYQILDWLSADLDISYTFSQFVKTGDAVPLAPHFLAYGGFTARLPFGLEGRIQMRHVGNRWGDEARTSVIDRYTIFDLLAKYKWDRFEFLFSILNLANTRWKAAQFFHDSQIRGNPRFPNELVPVNDIHFTPGEPLTIKAGMTIHLW